MRFLLGLIIGATATLMLAPRILEHTDPEQASDAKSLQRSVGEVLQAVAGRLQHAAAEPRSADDGTEAHPGALDEPLEKADESAVDRDPGSAPSVIDPVDAAAAATASYAREALPLPEIGATPSHDATRVEVVHPSPVGPMLTEISQDQSVWVPFRTESSARGFAAKLSERLNRPFQVLRAGPGQYLVVFGYQDEAERAAVLEQIKQLTGYVQI